MSNFKIGEKVVFVGDLHKLSDTIILPKINEIVTIDGFSMVNKGSLYIKEYMLNTEGITQSITSDSFRKIDYEFAENLLKEISKSVNQKHLQN